MINKRKVMPKVFVSLLAIGMVLLLGMQSAYAAAVTIKTIPAGTQIVSAKRKFPLKMSNCTAKWNGTKGKVVNSSGTVLYEGNGSFTPKKGNDGCYLFCIYLNGASNGTTKTTATTKSNFLDLTFSNVGKIGDKSIDCVVHFDYAKFSKKLGSGDFLRKDGYTAVCRVTDSDLWISADDTSGAGFAGSKKIKTTTTMKYHDSGETVSLPFFQTVRDIDTHGNYYDEAWQPGDGDDKSWSESGDNGYEPVIYKYKENTCKIDTTTGRVTTTGTSTDHAEDQIKKTGIYIRTKGGKFTSTFFEGNCATTLEVYSQYSATCTLTPPTLSVDKETAKPREKITYTVHQKVGKFYEDVMEPYEKIVFKDVIPDEVQYNEGWASAKLYDGTGKDISNNAVFKYDEATKTLTCTVKDSWVKTQANYNGQELRLEIPTWAKQFEGSEEIVSNIANVSLSDDYLKNTNTVKTKIIQFKPGDVTDYIQIQIKIPNSKNQLTAAHGNVTFMFKITGKENGEVFYDCVTFGKDNVSKDWTLKKDDNSLIAISKKYHLYENDGETYKVEAIPVSRFNINANDLIIEGGTNGASRTCTIYPFEASKDTWQYYSHNNIAVNESISTEHA